MAAAVVSQAAELATPTAAAAIAHWMSVRQAQAVHLLFQQLTEIDQVYAAPDCLTVVP